MNSLNALQKRYNELGAEIERLKNPPAKKGKVLEPLNGDDIHYVVFAYGVSEIQYTFEECDKLLIAIGSAYHDKESAQRALDAKKLALQCDQAIAKSWGDEKPNYTTNKQDKYSFAIRNNDLVVDSWFGIKSRFEFRLEEHAQAFIDEHGEKAVLNMLENY